MKNEALAKREATESLRDLLKEVRHKSYAMTEHMESVLENMNGSEEEKKGQVLQDLDSLPELAREARAYLHRCDELIGSFRTQLFGG